MAHNSLKFRPVVRARSSALLTLAAGFLTILVTENVRNFIGLTSSAQVKVDEVAPLTPPSGIHKESLLTWGTCRSLEEGVGVTASLNESLFDQIALFLTR